MVFARERAHTFSPAYTFIYMILYLEPFKYNYKAVGQIKAVGQFVYGGRSRRTRFLGDQLDRAGAGSWQIADGGATRKAAAGGTSVGDLRVHFVVEP